MNSIFKNLQIKVDFFSAILFLFFIQQLTLLVESIYMLNLLNTQMDIRALGISFLFLPGLLFAIKHTKSIYIIFVIAMAICILLSPILPTPWRIFSSGVGAGLFLTYLGIQLTDKNFPRVNWGQSAALATLTLILFRVIGHTQDISITGDTKFVGWGLIAAIIYLLITLLKGYPYKAESLMDGAIEKRKWIGTWLGIRGLGASFIFIYFVFSSPGVLARWTETNYSMIHILLVISIWSIVFFTSEKITSLKKNRLLFIIWNTLFLLIFIGNILLHRLSFPTIDHITPVIVEENNIIQAIVNYVMLVLSAIVFINIGVFAQSVKPNRPSKNVLPFLRAAALIIVCVFILIFTNTWGYVGAISKIFRNQFYLPFLIAGFLMTVPYLFRALPHEGKHFVIKSNKVLIVLAGFIVVLSLGFILNGLKKNEFAARNVKQLTLMTYNIQQGVDLYGNKNFEGQLRKIREINPDILCLQESDASRISGGNSDVVRYFSQKLGYHSYYGPKTVTGTYGTAILSRYPLENAKTIFTYSSKDEIGTAIAEISVNEKIIKIINSHPAGNDKSRQEHIDMVIKEAQENEHVIAMGDYNFRQDSPYYQEVTKSLKDSWLSLYPKAIGDIDVNLLDLTIQNRKTSGGKLVGNGKIDMHSRIDHIFLSNTFRVLKARYLPAPESETDHPLYWAIVEFKD